MQAQRNNADKPDLHYLHTWYNALCEVAQVCQAGAKKYARGNYLKGQPMSQLLSCAERHLMKFGSPAYSDCDEETKRHHLAHAIWNLLQALENDLNPTIKQRWDDRLRIPDEPKEKERTVQIGTGKEDSSKPNSEECKIPVREVKDIVPEEAKCVYAGLPVAESNHCGGEGAFRSFRSSEAFASKGATPGA